MAQKNRADVLSAINTLLADNGNGDISANDVRSVLTDLRDSYFSVLDDELQNIKYDGTYATLAAKLAALSLGARNTGSVAGLDPGNADANGTPYAVTGDFSAATKSGGSSGNPQYNDTSVLVTMSNAMDDNNYLVRCSIISQSVSLVDDNAIGALVWKPISTTQFEFNIAEFIPEVQNLKFFFEVVQL